jgi:hypothetical protein
METVLIDGAKIKDVIVVTTSTTAQDVVIGGRSFLIQNPHATAIAYFKEKNDVVATSSNGWMLPAGHVCPHKLTADTLSVVGSATGTVNIMIVE